MAPTVYFPYSKRQEVQHFADDTVTFSLIIQSSARIDRKHILKMLQPQFLKLFKLKNFTELVLFFYQQSVLFNVKCARPWLLSTESYVKGNSKVKGDIARVFC